MTDAAIPVYKPKAYRKAPELKHGQSSDHPVIIVGAGPIGLAMALDMGRRGHDVLVLTELDFIAHCSKAICFAKQALDILDRLGVGDRVVEKGVIWNVGKVFHGDSDKPIHQFDILPVKDQKNPGFVNIQQYYVEDYLCDALEAMDNVDIRWGHELTGVERGTDKCTLTVETKDGAYTLTCDYLLACDGAKSTVRDWLGLDFEGRIFEDNFLIADVSFKQERPSERWFWFDPPFNPGKSALLHKQPDNIWRLDFQLGWDIDRTEAVKPENVQPLIEGMLGKDVTFKEEWFSVYTFRCCRIARFLHGRVIFLGDSAHLVSPFGARGANSGLADVDNLGWKLDLVMRNKAPADLLETFNDERTNAADNNIGHSTRATDFITPKNTAAQTFRDAVLALAPSCEFARAMINSGRLYTATPYDRSVLAAADIDDWQGKGLPPGMMALDGPLVRNGEIVWLSDILGDDFTLLWFSNALDFPDRLKALTDVAILQIRTDNQQDQSLVDTGGLIHERYCAEEESLYLLRPDRHVAARFRSGSTTDIEAARRRAVGMSEGV